MATSSRGNWNEPVSLVVADIGWSRTGLVIVTWTPGSTAPDSSVTLPKISPVVCAHADVTLTTSARAANRAIERTLI